MSSIITHERISLTTGILTPGSGGPGILFGGNALQSISIGRHTPKNIVQAVGYLGIVDYTSGVITSDCQLDCVLVEASKMADTTNKTNSIYAYAALEAVVGAESYVMTSFGNTWAAGSPTTVNIGWLTSGLASYLGTQAFPSPGTGEESAFAVVLGDDGSGITLVPTFSNVTPLNLTNLPVLNASGGLQDLNDQGLPAGVQNINFNGGINRDQILDVRSTSPVQWVTTYPVDLRATMEIHMLPVTTANTEPGDSGYNPAAGGFDQIVGNLTGLSIQAGVDTSYGGSPVSLGKHLSTTPSSMLATAGATYIQAIGLTKTGMTEGVSVGRYLTYGFEFLMADLLLPMNQIISGVVQP